MSPENLFPLFLSISLFNNFSPLSIVSLNFISSFFKVSIIKDSVILSTDYTRDIKNDLKSDIQTLERTVDDIERRGKDVFKLVRDSIEVNDTKVRTMITVNSDRFDNRREQIRNDMVVLEKRINDLLATLKKEINDKIKKALENPLANMRK